MDFEQFLDAVSQSQLDAQAVECLRGDVQNTEARYDALDCERAVTAEVLARTCSL